MPGSCRGSDLASSREPMPSRTDGPAPRRHPLKRRACSFAGLGISVVCLARSKGRESEESVCKRRGRGNKLRISCLRWKYGNGGLTATVGGAASPGFGLVQGPSRLPDETARTHRVRCPRAPSAAADSGLGCFRALPAGRRSKPGVFEVQPLAWKLCLMSKHSKCRSFNSLRFATVAQDDSIHQMNL
jgi:hypothetical protein